MTKVCLQFIFPLKEKKVTSYSVNTKFLQISFWLICPRRYGHINIYRKLQFPGVDAFKGKMIQLEQKQIALHWAF